MINRVKLINDSGESLEIILREPERSGYAITNITGIEPTDVDLKTTQISTGTKFIFNKGFHKNRNISFTILYYQHNDLFMSIEELRDYFYKLFRPNTKIKMIFDKDKGSRAIEGYISKNSGSTFSSMCGDDFVVQCPDIWFTENDVDFRKTSNIGISNDEYKTDILYNGTFQTGFIFEFVNRSSVGISGDFLLTVSGNKTQTIYLSIPTNTIDSGDHFQILTEDDKLIVRYSKDSSPDEWIEASRFIDIRQLVQRQDFPRLLPGLNTITFEKAEGSFSQGDLDATVSYKSLFMGV